MRLKDLERELGRVRPFDTKVQKIELEQFPTSSHIAARLICTASENGDIEGKVVVDLGVGTAMLAIGCALMGAASVIGIDADGDALEIARENASVLGVDLDLILGDVCSLPVVQKRTVVDTIIMNPPFGTRNKGIDVMFLEKAIMMKPRCIYSLHKTSTRKFLLKQAQRWGVEIEVLAELRFDIPKVFQIFCDFKRKCVPLCSVFRRCIKCTKRTQLMLRLTLSC